MTLSRKYFVSKSVSKFSLATFFCTTLIKEIGSEVLHGITATSEVIVENSNILVALFFSSSRQPSESSVSLFLWSMNFDLFLTKEGKLKHNNSSQAHKSLFAW